MRTTIEIHDEHRAKLLELAARRGRKGFSDIVNEAIEMYLKLLTGAGSLRSKLVKFRGALPSEDAEALRKRVYQIHRSWR